MQVNGYKIEPWANLTGANLTGANLYGANLTRANLYGANLTGANLTRANLYGANLTGANLTRANLYGANLTGANLTGADLYGANLTGANLTGADLYGANLYGANLPHFQICPEEGGFFAFKKTCQGVVKLFIPADAKRTSSLIGRKCRAEYAIVAEGNGQSLRDHSFTYTQGEKVIPDGYDDDIRIECAKGIHFFITRKEAEEYN